MHYDKIGQVFETYAYEQGEWNIVAELAKELQIQVDDLAYAYIAAVLWMQTFAD